MKRLAWLVLIALCTLFVQAPATAELPAKAKGCCAHACCAAKCPCAIAAPAQPDRALTQADSTLKHPERREQVADSLRLLAIHAFLSEPALPRHAPPRLCLEEVPASVPLFRAHCSLLI